MESNFDVRDFPVIKEIREKGLVGGSLATIDNIVERATAGLNIADLRSMLRGDAPPRPNPRLKPHADGFWLHMRPGYYNTAVTGLYPTFRLGWLTTYFFAFELITGIFLMVFYTPSTEYAYPNMLYLLSNVPFGKFVRDLHRLGAEAMVLFIALHMIRTYITASYKKPRQFTWVTGMILLVLTLFLSFTGYLLPWDQLAYWAVTIGASMAEAAPPPIVGQFANILMRGGPDLGQLGLLRFYMVHVIGLPVLTAIFIGVHYYKVIIHGHSLPPELEESGKDSAKRVPVDSRKYYLPDIQASELLWIGVVTLILIFAVTFFYSAPLENHANPLSTPFHSVAPWYFYWAQGLLKLGDKTLMGVIIPTILLVMFTVMPYFDPGPYRYYGRRRFALSLSMVFIYFMIIFSWMGTPFFAVQSTYDQEIMHHLAPTEKPGEVRHIPFDELQAAMAYGELNVDTFEEVVPRSTELYEVLDVFREEMEYARDLAPERGGLGEEAAGFFTVTPLQPDVVAITLRIEYVSPTDGTQVVNEVYVPVHRDAYIGSEE